MYGADRLNTDLRRNSMETSKWLIGSTLAFVVALFAGGIYYPDTLIMSFAETGSLFTWLRGIMIVLLLSLLVTNPPRSKALRSILAVWAVVLGWLGLSQMYMYELNPLDAAVFLELSIIFAIEALEARQIPVHKKPTIPKKISVVSI